jgi:hypothetical protein
MTSLIARGRWPHRLVVAGLWLAAMGHPPTGGYSWAQVVQLRQAANGDGRVYRIDEPTFNALLYGNSQAAKTARERLDAIVSLKVAETDRICDLSVAQRELLTLAGQGDVERLFTRIEGLKEGLGQPLSQEAYVKMHEDLRQFQSLLGPELFGEASLLSKFLYSMLDESQAARHREARSERARMLYREKVDQFVIYLDYSLALSADQRRRLVRVLVEETRPPKQFTAADSAVILYQMARIPESRLRPVFDDAQWQSLGRRFALAKASEEALKQKGVLPDGVGDHGRPTP